MAIPLAYQRFTNSLRAEFVIKLSDWVSRPVSYTTFRNEGHELASHHEPQALCKKTSSTSEYESLLIFAHTSSHPLHQGCHRDRRRSNILPSHRRQFSTTSATEVAFIGMRGESLGSVVRRFHSRKISTSSIRRIYMHL